MVVFLNISNSSRVPPMAFLKLSSSPSSLLLRLSTILPNLPNMTASLASTSPAEGPPDTWEIMFDRLVYLQ